MNSCSTRQGWPANVIGWPLVLGAMLVSLAFAMPALAQFEHDYGDIRVQTLPGTSMATTHGYAAHRFVITNDSEDESHVVRIDLVADSFRGGHRMTHIYGSPQQIAPGSSARIRLYQPAVPMYSPRANVTIDGERQDESVPMNELSHGESDRYHSAGARAYQPTVLLAPRLSPDLRSELHRYTGRHHSVGSRSPYSWQLSTAATYVEQWSPDWIAYSRYDVIVLGADDLERADSAVRDAIWRWVSCGGVLLIVGDAGQFEPPEPGIEMQTSPFSSDVSQFYLGFGQCMVARSDDLQDMGSSAASDMLTEWNDAMQPFATARSAMDANRTFPVVEEFDIPVRSLLGLVALFALIIGPLNLILLARMNRRIWMLWTVPLVSLLFSVAVFGWAVVSEGWNPTARSAGITVLDQRVNRASSVGWIGYYAPMTPGQALRFDRQSVLNPQIARDSFRDGGQGRRMQWGSDQRLTAGWVDARVPAIFSWRRSEQRRERVTVRREEGELIAVNGLGAPIKELHVADAQGNIYQASNVDAGAEVRLQRGNGTATGSPDELAWLYRFSNWPRSVRVLRSSPGDYLQPNTYLATLDEPPFIEPGLDNLREHRSDWAVYGILDAGNRGESN